MEPEALVTFIFRAPWAVRTVELLGSWDNFQQPYRMHNDRRRGAGFWSGCFKFENIIFDGDHRNWGKGRSGGLKQGTTYWYYYRLDDDVEAFDDILPYTSECALLPGQTLNVVEVPSEIQDRPLRRRSTGFDIIGTLAQMQSMSSMDPGDKYALLDPPPLCKVHKRCQSDLALSGRLERCSVKSTPLSPSHSPKNLSSGYDSLSRKRTRSGKPVSQRRSTESLRSYVSFSELYSRQGLPVSQPERPTTRHGISAEDVNISRPLTSYAWTSRSTFRLGMSRRELTADLDEERENIAELASPTPNAHFLGARPATRFDFPQQQRSRLPSLPTINGQPEHYAPSRPSVSGVSENTSVESYSPRIDRDVEPEDEVWSPTFSAQTISSAGAETPFQLSALHSRAATLCLDGEYENGREQDQERGNDADDPRSEILNNFDAQSQPHYQDPTPTDSTLHSSHHPHTTLLGYSLPHDALYESTSTIAKLSSPRSNRSVSTQYASAAAAAVRAVSGGAAATAPGTAADADKPLPSLPAVLEHDRGAGSSMADAIFSELGYLGGSIA